MDGASERATVVVAGASGFVGRALLDKLAERFDVVALSRRPRPDRGRVRWRACNLFSLLDTEEGVAGATYAVYLVHSMLPARFTQASFRDIDWILADNFSRACARAGVEQVVYLGGIRPQDDDALSEHLASRQEVAKALASRGTAVTELKAGLIIGAGGSSFRIMIRLVERLPIMITPRWTQSQSRPVAVEDVVTLIDACVANRTTYGESHDIGGPDELSYVDMMKRAAEALGKRRWVVPIPLFSLGLSIRWVQLFSGAPHELVAPLVRSLEHDMRPGALALQEQLRLKGQSFDESLAKAVACNPDVAVDGGQNGGIVGAPDEVIAGAETKESQHRRGGDQRDESRPSEELQQSGPVARVNAPGQSASKANVAHELTRVACSVQRLPLPTGRDAFWVARAYAKWLPRVFRPFIRVEILDDGSLHFRLLGMQRALLELTYAEDRSVSDRPLYYITGGLLSDTARMRELGLRGRLEFRADPEGRFIVAAIYDFCPRLPWPLYRISQAPVHLWVMRAFGRYLGRQLGGDIPRGINEYR